MIRTRPISREVALEIGKNIVNTLKRYDEFNSFGLHGSLGYGKAYANDADYVCFITASLNELEPIAIKYGNELEKINRMKFVRTEYRNSINPPSQHITLLFDKHKLSIHMLSVSTLIDMMKKFHDFENFPQSFYKGYLIETYVLYDKDNLLVNSKKILENYPQNVRKELMKKNIKSFIFYANRLKGAIKKNDEFLEYYCLYQTVEKSLLFVYAYNRLYFLENWKRIKEELSQNDIKPDNFLIDLQQIITKPHKDIQYKIKILKKLEKNFKKICKKEEISLPTEIDLI
jgi:hypothetical protein